MITSEICIQCNCRKIGLTKHELGSEICLREIVTKSDHLPRHTHKHFYCDFRGKFTSMDWELDGEAVTDFELEQLGYTFHKQEGVWSKLKSQDLVEV